MTKNSASEMTFWGHVNVLRRVLFRVSAISISFAVLLFMGMPWFFDRVILAPCHDNFVFYQLLQQIGGLFHLTNDFFVQEFDIKLVNISLTSPFLIHISTSFWLALVLIMPYLLLEFWWFMRPALYPKEIKSVRFALFLSSALFYLGVLIGYFMVFPLTLRFLATYTISNDIPNQLSLDSYIDNFMTLILLMGLVFELPLFTWLLSFVGLVNAALLRKYRRHAIVVIFIIAAIITPTGDPFTLSVVALPLCLLYEFGILLIRKKHLQVDSE